MSLIRCGWVNLEDELYLKYHDEEWGVPVREENALFERISLEGAQAGLSWITILRRREHYRAAFDSFDPAVIARYDEARIAALLQDPGIIRNRAKVRSVVKNARAFLHIQGEIGSFSEYLWGFVEGQTIHNHRTTLADIPAETDLSRQMSKDLKRRGFTFVGPTICYAMMQAIGMVNDHTIDCFRHDELS
ncbi:MAG: DNA-3-methyladenine glycosylase I [Anaerolineae bacterium]|nr:DNA-3-methyladenine glycosylase I [Anaerolineae bacterium]